MQEIALEELQKIEYKILCTFAKICVENHLRYGLCGGTLLGAVRHGGFIPWDDDIDVEMPRPDYMKFIQLAATKLPSEYAISSPYNDQNTFHTYTKILDKRTRLLEFPDGKKVETCVYMDIFPIDGMPDSAAKQEKHRLRVRRRMLALYGFHIAKYKLNEHRFPLSQIFWRLAYGINKLIPEGCLIKWVDSLVLKYDFDESEYNSLIVAGYGARETMPHQVYDFSGYIRFVDQTFHTFRIPDQYLSKIYGDYMTIPPDHERISHDFRAWKL